MANQFPIAMYAEDLEILAKCRRAGLAVSYEHSHHNFSWLIENRCTPWWEDAWIRAARRVEDFVCRLSFERLDLHIPCLGCILLGEYKIGVGSTLKEAWIAFHCDTRCLVGDCDQCPHDPTVGAEAT